MSQDLPGRADVVILGAGAVGLSLAFELARRGVETLILERGTPADPATSALGAAAGMINVQAHPGVEPEPVRELSLLSRHLYPEWIEAIETEAGVSCEYDLRGGLTVALTDAQEVQLDRALDWQRARALPFEVLSAEEARAREPSLGAAVQAAFAFPLDGQIAPQKLGRALSFAAQRAGAVLKTRIPVTAVVVEQRRAAGVDTPAGRVLAGAVVNAAGAWASHLPGVPPAPIVPVKGQLVALDASDDAERLTRFVFSPDVYLVPRRDGTLVVGSTLERSGFDARPTASAISRLIEQAVRIVPAAGGYALAGAWAGLRPASPDDVPILGEATVAGYWLATGHFRNGVLLAPATAVLMADLLTGQTPPLPPAPYSPARFDL